MAGKQRPGITCTASFRSVGPAVTRTRHDSPMSRSVTQSDRRAVPGRRGVPAASAWRVACAVGLSQSRCAVTPHCCRRHPRQGRCPARRGRKLDRRVPSSEWRSLRAMWRASVDIADVEHPIAQETPSRRPKSLTSTFVSVPASDLRTATMTATIGVPQLVTSFPWCRSR